MNIEKTLPILENLIANALPKAQALLQQLEQEAAHLKTGQQPATIDLLAANKKQLSSELELFNSQLGQVLATETFDNNPQGLQNYFDRAASHGLDIDAATNNWTQLLSICAECRVLNEQNGAGIQLLLVHSKRALQILKGNGKSELANTYGRDGTTRSEFNARSLISV